ncbi:MAG: hypothetical protein AB8B87_13455 [Granulosicoccus sp.]
MSTADNSGMHHDALRHVLPESVRSMLRALLGLVLLSGVLFYVCFRPFALHALLPQSLLSHHWQSILPEVFLSHLPVTVYHSFPSFIGGLSVVLFVALLPSVRRTDNPIALSVAVATLSLFEIFVGYFHWQDIVATLAGTLTGLCLIRCLVRYRSMSGKVDFPAAEVQQSLPEPTSSTYRYTLFPATAAVLFSSLLAIGSTWTNDYSSNECARYSEEGFCEEYKRDAQPVYMSYEQLRSSVKIESARAPDRIGRLYLYGDYVFLNEVNEGIHIIDNAEPTLPVNLGFIRIPGNTEIAVRDNYLYADSYVDLLTLDINDPMTLSVISRQQSIFPFDAYQNIPQNITFSGFEIDREQGVVVSYRLEGS